VPLPLANISVDKLRSLGYAIDWSEYPMEHQVMMDQIKDIGVWINRIFST